MDLQETIVLRIKREREREREREKEAPMRMIGEAPMRMMNPSVMVSRLDLVVLELAAAGLVFRQLP